MPKQFYQVVFETGHGFWGNIFGKKAQNSTSVLQFTCCTAYIEKKPDIVA